MMKKLFFLVLCACLSKGFSVSIDYVTPINGYINPGFTTNFNWNPVLNFNSYKVRVATDLAFTNIIKDTIVNNSSLTLNFNSSLNKIYWQVSLANTTAYVTSDIDTLRFISPSQDPNILLWLAADSNVVIQPDSTVVNWTSIVNSSIIATQSDPTKRPRLLNNVSDLNNKPAVHFDGTLSALSTSVGGGPIGNAYALFNWTGGGSTFSNYLGILTSSASSLSASDYLFETMPGAGTLYGGYYTGDFYINNVSRPNLSPIDKYKVLSGRKNLPTKSYPGFTIGRDVSGGGWWNGNMAEIIVSKSNTTTESDSIHKYLYNKYSPPVSLGKDIVAGTSFTDSVTLNPGSRFVSYLWPHNGSTASTIKVATGGTYTVKTKDIFGFDTEDEVQVYPYKRLNNLTVYFCIGDSLTLDLGITSPFSFRWFKDNVPTGNTSNKITIKNTGLYTVQITDFKGKTISDTLNVVIDEPKLLPTPDVSNNLRVCLNEKLFLTSSTVYDSIRWSTGSTAVFIPITAAGPYSVYGRTASGCVINQSFNVTIAGEAPVAKFGYSSVCQNASTSFSDSSTHSAGSTITNWKWTFGDNNSSTIQNPFNTYTNLGSYTVGFKVTTNQGCSDSIAKTILVNKKPIPSFYNLLSCAGIPTTFADQSTPNSASISDWAWDFNGLGVINGVQNPSFRFPSAGIYNVRLKATNSNGCFDTITIQTSVNVSPVSNFSYDSVCGKTPVNLKFLATVEPPSTIPDLNWGNWDFGDGTIETAIRNPQHVYAGPGTYEVRLIVKSSGQCIDTAIKQVKVFDFPTVDFSVSQTQCTGKEIQFTDISFTPDGTPLTKWNWFFSGLGSDTIKNPRYTFNTQGNYTIQLTARNSVGCVGTKLRSIAVSAPPVPKFTFSPNGLPAPLNVNYTNQSPLSGNYIWDYGDGSPLIQAYNPPQHQYTVNGSYPIKLIATDFRGCTDTLTKYILVDKAYLDGVMASITITPNGDYYKIQANVFNNSNIEITALGLSLQLGGGAVIRENWTGSLLPGQSVVYAFVGEIKIGESGQLPIVCATIDNINNNTREDRTDNNTTCKEVKVGSFDILNIYPNPAYDNINFGVMLPKDGRVNIRFIDIVGQQMYNKDFDGIKGYNAFAMPTAMLNAAVYVAEVSYDGEVIRKKFMRKDRK